VTWGWLWVAIGGFFGACARYGLSDWAGKRFPSRLPRATLFINLSGSFLLGVLLGAKPGEAAYLLLGTGFMGAYTTFSTFNTENVQLIRNKAWGTLALYMAASYALGIALAFAGTWIGAALQG